MHEESLVADPRFWIAVAFVIFVAVLGGRIWKALTGMLDKRADAVRAELAEAQRLRQEAEQMLADATARREAAMSDAQRLLEGARAEAQRLAQAAAADAEASARRRERMAMDRIAAAEKAAVNEVRVAAAELAATASESAIRENLGADAQARLIDQSIGHLTSALASRRAA